jgi:hypothetical protein
LRAAPRDSIGIVIIPPVLQDGYRLGPWLETEDDMEIPLTMDADTTRGEVSPTVATVSINTEVNTVK